MEIDASGGGTTAVAPPPPKPAQSNAAPASSSSSTVAQTGDAIVKGTAVGSQMFDLKSLQAAGILPQGHLEANHTYHANNGFAYTTDSFGRLSKATGTINSSSVASGPRGSAAQQVQADAAARGGRSTSAANYPHNDVGGHPLGHQFGAPTTDYSTVPQNAGMNNTGYKSLEGQFAKLRDSGHTVDVSVTMAYDNGGNRPSHMTVDYSVDGNKMPSRVFANEAPVYNSAGKPVKGSTEVSGAAAEEVGGATRSLENAAKFARGVDAVGKVALPVGIAMDTISLANAYHQDGNKIGKNTQETAGSVAGGWAGAVAGGEVGAEAGAAIGSVVPGAGTVVGGVVGGVVGSVGGAIVGSGVGKKAVDFVRSLF